MMLDSLDYAEPVNYDYFVLMNRSGQSQKNHKSLFSAEKWEIRKQAGTRLDYIAM